jgi:L-threonylcarbamoyladenylate synthase
MDIMPGRPRVTTDVSLAIAELAAGRLVAVPTETVYGLAADATDPSAVAKVFELKGRPADHPLILHCGSAEQAWESAALVTPSARELAAVFWPGPLTLVLPRAAQVSPMITAGQDSVALRVPAHPLMLELLQRFQRPLVAPSANRFGRVSPTTAQHILEEFPFSSLLILDGGPCPIGIESTIVDCRHPGLVKILRPGKITAEAIGQVLGDNCFDADQQQEMGAVRVSGDLPTHYAPQAKVYLVEPEGLELYLKNFPLAPDSTMVLATRACPAEYADRCSWHQVSSNPDQFAAEIYGLFRAADREGAADLIVELPDAAGIGIALRDRLQRAAFRES